MITETVVRVPGTTFPSNTYLAQWGAPSGCIIIDPGLDVEPIEEALSLRGLQPLAILLTHGHFDHIGSASHFQREFGIDTYMHSADVKIMRASNFLMMAIGIKRRITLPEVHLLNEAVNQINISGITATLALAPGHTPGSCLVHTPAALFSGDTIYAKGIGLSKLPGEDLPQLRTTIRSIWHSIPDDRHICPGHGISSSWASIRTGNFSLIKFAGIGTTNDDQTSR